MAMLQQKRFHLASLFCSFLLCLHAHADDIKHNFFRSSSPQAPYTAGHSTAAACDGKDTGNMWHVTGQETVQGKFVFKDACRIDSLRFANPSFSALTLKAYTREGDEIIAKQFTLAANKEIQFEEPLRMVKSISLEIKNANFFHLAEISAYQKEGTPLDTPIKEAKTPTPPDLTGVNTTPQEPIRFARAESSQKPFSANHSILIACDGVDSDNNANWHLTGQDLVEGTFYFDKPQDLNGLQFSNPSFNTLSLSITSQGKEKNLGELSLSASKRINFKKKIPAVSKIKISIKDNAAFFHLAEVSGYARQRNKQDKLLLSVFKDLSCSELRPNVTQEQIAKLPRYFQQLAKALSTGKYANREYRIASYKAYSHPNLAQQKYAINALSPLDNPTGIAARAGEKILVLVGPTHGEDIALACNKDYTLSYTSYPLSEGVNIIEPTHDGLLYLLYHTDISKAKPSITVQIPGGFGTVNRYFDISKHDDKQWEAMIEEATYPLFDIIGKYSMFILHTQSLQMHAPESIVPSIKVWDRTMESIWKIQGLRQASQPINNRQLGISFFTGAGHMFSTNYFCGYSVGTNGSTILNELLAPGILKNSRLWGIGHETGHSNQYHINWQGMTETSTNFFSQLCLDQVTNEFNGNEDSYQAVPPCSYLTSDVLKGKAFEDVDFWPKWGFSHYSFYLYFHKLGIDPTFYPRLFESLRRKPLPRDTNVAPTQLAWYERICEVSKTDFTEDFELFNWFLPIDKEANQYGAYTCRLTQEDANAAKARVAAKKYPKPKYRLAFLHQSTHTPMVNGTPFPYAQRNGFWRKYKADEPLSSQVKASIKDRTIKVTQGENAAAFCIKTQGKIVAYFDLPEYTLPEDITWDDSSEIYAIPMRTAEPYKRIYPTR